MTPPPAPPTFSQTLLPQSLPPLAIQRLCLARHAFANKTLLFVFPTCADNIATMSVDNIQGTTNGASLLPRTAPKRKAPKKHGKSNGQQKTP